MDFKFLYFLPLVILGIACDDADDTGPNERTINVAAFHAVDVHGNTVIRFDPALSTSETIIIKGNPGDVGNVRVQVTDGRLVIRSSNNVQLHDSLTIIANPASLTGITLEADQQAAIYWEGEHNYLLGNLASRQKPTVCWDFLISGR